MFMFSHKNDLSSFKGGKIVVKLDGNDLKFAFDIN